MERIKLTDNLFYLIRHYWKGGSGGEAPTQYKDGTKDFPENQSVLSCRPCIGYQKKMSNLEDNPPRDYDLWNLNSINLLLFYFEFMYVRDRRLSLFDLRIY